MAMACGTPRRSMPRTTGSDPTRLARLLHRAGSSALAAALGGARPARTQHEDRNALLDVNVAVFVFPYVDAFAAR